MARLFLAAAALIVSLGACQAEGTEQPASSGAAEAVAEDVIESEEAPEARADAALESGKSQDSGCGADKLGRWLNILPTAEVKAQIAATVGRRTIRYIGPGDAVTMDFSPARLNVELGEDGRIKLFRCG